MPALFRAFASARRRANRAAVWALGLAAALAVNGCGGGIWFGIGDDFDDLLPVVSLAASVTTVPAGQPVRLVAAAADENGIDSVAFFRIDPGGAVFLDSDGVAPYETVVTAPTDGRTTLSVFARATDGAGNRNDSSVVTIAITP